VRERESANGILVNLVAREGHQFSPSQADCAPVAGMLPASIFMQPDWRMNQFSDLVPNGMQVSGSIHFQHPGGPAAFRGYSSADPPAENPNCHLATGAAFYAQLASQSVLPWICHLSFHYLVSGIWTSVRPLKAAGHTTRAANGPLFQAPIINGWVFSLTR
jgi:hypothetical protein